MMDCIMKASFREVDFILRNAPFVQLAVFDPNIGRSRKTKSVSKVTNV